MLTLQVGDLTRDIDALEHSGTKVFFRAPDHVGMPPEMLMDPTKVPEAFRLGIRQARDDIVELLGLQEQNSSVVYEQIEIERWVSNDQEPPVWVGMRDGEVDDRLTRMMEGARFQKKRGRLVMRAVE